MKIALKRILYAGIIAALFSCNNNDGLSVNHHYVTNFDISNNDSIIILSIANQQSSSICQSDMYGKNLKEIVSAVNDTNFFSPKYSRDNSKILFIGQSRQDNFSTIYIANSDGTQRLKIGDVTEIISEAFFSSCEDRVYYVKINSYGRSSPIAKDGMHGADVRYINLKDETIGDVTKLNAYSISDVSEYKCDSMIISITGPEDGGMFLFSKLKPQHLVKVNPKNDPMKGLGVEGALQYSEKANMFGFTAPYDIFVMDEISNSVKSLVRSDDNLINNFRFLHTKKALLFTKQNDTTLNYINLDGTNIKKYQLSK